MVNRSKVLSKSDGLRGVRAGFYRWEEKRRWGDSSRRLDARTGWTNSLAALPRIGESVRCRLGYAPI